MINLKDKNINNISLGDMNINKVSLGEYLLWGSNVDWTYEGILTVGEEDSNNPNTNYIYSIGFGAWHEGHYFGIIDPNNDWLIERLIYIPSISSINIIVSDGTILSDVSINGIEFNILNGYDGFIHSESNPFPPIGDQCEIKLKYTTEYTLKINDGSGSGSYEEGTVVEIGSYSSNGIFLKWEDNTHYYDALIHVNNIYDSITQVTIPNINIELAAVYQLTYSGILTVNKWWSPYGYYEYGYYRGLHGELNPPLIEDIVIIMWFNNTLYVLFNNYHCPINPVTLTIDDMVYIFNKPNPAVYYIQATALVNPFSVEGSVHTITLLYDSFRINYI